MEAGQGLDDGEAGVADLAIVCQSAFGVAEGGVGFVELVELGGGDRRCQRRGVGVIKLAPFSIRPSNLLHRGSGVQAELVVVGQGALGWGHG
jgi:hypothetical protein